MQKEYLYVALSGILSGVIVFGGAVFVSLGLTLFEMSIVPQALGLARKPFNEMLLSRESI